MYTILLYPNGRRVDGIILSASEDVMRVVVQRRADTIELRRAGGVWMSEAGSHIEFESLMIFNSETKPLTLTAGGRSFEAV